MKLYVGGIPLPQPIGGILDIITGLIILYLSNTQNIPHPMPPLFSLIFSGLGLLWLGVGVYNLYTYWRVSAQSG